MLFARHRGEPLHSVAGTDSGGYHVPQARNRNTNGHGTPRRRRRALVVALVVLAGIAIFVGGLLVAFRQADSESTVAMTNEMLAVYHHLEEEDALPGLSVSYAADEGGRIYAVVATAIEDVDGSPADVEYRLYDSGEAVNDVQVVQERIVLRKCYPGGEREDEVVGSYLVDFITLEVTDEQV